MSFQEWNEKYHVQFVWGPLEQTYRLPVEGWRTGSVCKNLPSGSFPRVEQQFLADESGPRELRCRRATDPPEAMTTAEEKRDQHIVEYILYVWQMEDLVRAVELDLAALRTHLSSAYARRPAGGGAHVVCGVDPVLAQ